jgi:hypothetical protein
MGTSSKELARKLEKWASKQHGCFTATQAIDTGYADSVHLYHVKNGGWIRVYRGVYRLSTHPETPESRCMAALLWTRNKQGDIQGVLASQTIHSLKTGTLSNSDPICLGVPRGFRRSSSVPDGIRIQIIEKKKRSTSKYCGMPVETIPENPSEMNFTRPDSMDLPDYYDWIDYQQVLCDINP